MKNYCCGEMRIRSESGCTEHADDPGSCPDVLVVHSDQHGPGLPIPETAGGGMILIEYCPWCAKWIGNSRP